MTELKEQESQLDAAPSSANAEIETLYCVNHPSVETLLRCNRCGKPICLKCATLTDVGYRCNECIRGVQAKYFNAVPVDNLIAFFVAAVVAGIAAPIAAGFLRFFGFFGFIFAFMAGGAAGSLLAQIIRTSVGKRRGRHLRYYALAGIIVGVIVGGFVGLFFGIWPLNLPMLLFTVLASVAAYQFLR